MEIQLTQDNFQKEVNSSGELILVDFWAPWCGPCHMIAPILQELEKEYEGKLKIGKLNVDENQELAQQYQISSIPNMKFFKGGRVVDEVIGVVPKTELKNRIEKLI